MTLIRARSIGGPACIATRDAPTILRPDREILARLRAKPFVERLDAAMDRPSSPAPEPTRTWDPSTV